MARIFSTAVLAAVAGSFACSGSSDYGAIVDPAPPAPAASATPAEDAGTPTPSPAGSSSSGEAKDAGAKDSAPACPTRWTVLQYGGTWDTTKETVAVLGGALRLQTTPQPGAVVTCHTQAGLYDVFCQPLRIVQEVTGDFDVSVDVTAFAGTPKAATSGSTIDHVPVAGLFLAVKGTTGYHEHAHAAFRHTTDQLYAVDTYSPILMTSTTQGGDRYDVVPGGKIHAARSGSALTFVVTFTSSSGSAGVLTQTFHFEDDTLATNLVVGLYVGANATSLADMDTSARFDNFVVAGGSGLVADDFGCNSVP